VLREECLEGKALLYWLELGEAEVEVVLLMVQDLSSVEEVAARVSGGSRCLLSSFLTVCDPWEEAMAVFCRLEGEVWVWMLLRSPEKSVWTKVAGYSSTLIWRVLMALQRVGEVVEQLLGVVEGRHWVLLAAAGSVLRLAFASSSPDQNHTCSLLPCSFSTLAFHRRTSLPIVELPPFRRLHLPKVVQSCFSLYLQCLHLQVVAVLLGLVVRPRRVPRRSPCLCR
jgi:hypothetical protein